MLIIKKKKPPIPDDINKRRGKFSIAWALLSKPTESLLEFLSNFIITRAEFMWDTESMDYVALSRLFEPVANGERTPEYQFEIIELEDEGIDIKTNMIPDERGKKLLRLLRKLDG